MNLFDLIYVLTQKELKVRYKHHVLGYLWSVANPLAFATIYFLIFKLVMKVKVDDFPIFLISGLFPWQWIANSAGVAPMTFIGNGSLIKKVKFPRNTLSFVVVLQDMIHFLVAIPIVVVFLFIFNKTPSWSWLLGVPLLSLIQLGFTYAINLFFATTNLFFRDMEKLVQIAITFLFYLTPIVYKAEMVPERFQIYLLLNPAAPLIISWRELFLNNHLSWLHIGVSFTWSMALVILAQYTYKKLSWRFAEII